MKIFIPRIPDHSTRIGLWQFIESGCNSRIRNPFTKRPVVVSCEIIVIEEQCGVKERHGLVEIKPDSAAESVARRLHGKSFKGKRVAVRLYIDRKAKKDMAPQDERRRPDLKVAKRRDVEIEGLDRYSRSFLRR